MVYRGTSLKRKRTPLGPYRSPMHRVLGGSKGGGRFLMGEVPLQGCTPGHSWKVEFNARVWVESIFRLETGRKSASGAITRCHVV